MNRLLRAKCDLDLLSDFSPKARRLAELQAISNANSQLRRAGFPGNLSDEPDPIETKALRDGILTSLPRVKDLAVRLTSQKGGTQMLPASDLDALLTYGQLPSEHRGKVDDVLRQLQSSCGMELASAKRAVRNPLVWLRDGAALVLGLPRYVLSLAGYDSADASRKTLHVFLKIVWWVFLVVVLLWLGLSRGEIARILTRALGGGR